MVKLSLPLVSVNVSKVPLPSATTFPSIFTFPVCVTSKTTLLELKVSVLDNILNELFVSSLFLSI